MINALMFNRNKEEAIALHRMASSSVAFRTDEKMDFSLWAEPNATAQKVEEKKPLDVAMVDVIADKGIEVAKDVRKISPDTSIMIIADSSISPMEYMVPEIRAASLLLRPYTRENAKKVVDNFFAVLLAERESEDTADSCFVLENQDGKTLIPYNQIYYFEVSEKKIYIRLKNRELCRYGTMEQLEQSLPEQFARCHRSYIVNLNLITRIKLSEGLIDLPDGIVIPLSRSYKSGMKEYVHGISRR